MSGSQQMVTVCEARPCVAVAPGDLEPKKPRPLRPPDASVPRATEQPPYRGHVHSFRKRACTHDNSTDLQSVLAEPSTKIRAVRCWVGDRWHPCSALWASGVHWGV